MIDRIKEPEIHWTWADLVSSYRFWALVIFTFCIAFNLMLLSIISPYIMSDFGLTHKDIGLIFFMRTMGFLSIIPAWIAARIKSYNPLYFFALMICLALLIAYYTGDFLVLIICAFMIGLFSASSALLIAANIAKAVNRIEGFVLVFGLITIIIMVSHILSVPIYQYIITKMGYRYNYIVVFALMVISVLFLLPMQKSLFSNSPQIRQVKVIDQEYREPMQTFLLFTFIPFYSIYWFVKVHYDIRIYSQSARLLTPVAAGWCALLVPFAMAIMLVNLTDILDEISFQKKRSRCKFIIVSCLFPPIAVALVQDRLNQLLNMNQNGDVL